MLGFRRYGWFQTNHQARPVEVTPLVPKDKYSSIKSVDSLVLNIGSLTLLSFHTSMDIFKILGRIIVGVE